MPIKKVPTLNASALIETSQKQVAFSNNCVQPQRARRRSGRVSDLRRSDLTTIDELGSNRNQNNNSAGGRPQNLGMHTIVEDDIRRLRGDGNGLFDPIPGWQNPAIVREITQSTQPQGDVHVIPIENDTDTSNSTNSIKCCNLGANGSCCFLIIVMLLLLLLISTLLYVCLVNSNNHRKVLKLPEVSNSPNDLWDDYDSHYVITKETTEIPETSTTIAPQKVR